MLHLEFRSNTYFQESCDRQSQALLDFDNIYRGLQIVLERLNIDPPILFRAQDPDHHAITFFNHDDKVDNANLAIKLLSRGGLLDTVIEATKCNQLGEFYNVRHGMKFMIWFLIFRN